ncbi:MAG: hypothetical protein Q4B57_05080 [Eubacteriales bacterium]|nr:hypothetical protein [Eubacteriales bacterium]
MDERYKGLRRILMVVALGQMVLALGLMIYGLKNQWISDMQSNALMGGSLLLYWVLMDIVEPVTTHRFDGIVPEQKTAYFKFMVMDLVGFAGILYFLIGMGGASGSGNLLGAAVFAAVMKPKRDNQRIFYGLDPIPGTEEEEEEQAQIEDSRAEESANE